MGAAFKDAAVRAVFDGYAAPLRTPLLRLRTLILESAAATPAIGTVSETLKWGQPSYLPATPRTGSTVRIGPVDEATYAAFFHCQTTLLQTFREIYPGVFKTEGERALLFSVARPPPVKAFKHCVALALTYHLGKGPRSAPVVRRRPGA